MITATRWIIEALFLLIALGFFLFMLYLFAWFLIAAVQKIKKEVRKHDRDE